MTAERRVAVWNATHDNGWTTHAIENPDGTYSAWTAPSGTTAAVEYVEDGPEHARIAAEYALRQKTGHARCSAGCSGWQVHYHEADVNGDDAP